MTQETTHRTQMITVRMTAAEAARAQAVADLHFAGNRGELLRAAVRKMTAYGATSAAAEAAPREQNAQGIGA